MLKDLPPRILVADDDLGVIAAYRYVLEGDEGRACHHKAAVHVLENDLFGKVDGDGAEDSTWRVDFVDRGEDAVSAVLAATEQSDPFSVVFLDIRMCPGFDGYETAQMIRQLDPAVHIVFVSAYSDYAEEDLIEVAGPQHCVSFLPKPVWPQQLRSKVRAIVNDQNWKR